MVLKDDTKLVITLGFSAILVLMSLLVYIAFRQLQDLNDGMSNVVEETNTKIEAANSMRDAIRMRSNSLKSMALTSDLFERDDEYMRFITHSRLYREARETLITKQMDVHERDIHARISDATRSAQPLNDRAAELLLSAAPASEISAAVTDATLQQELVLNLLNELVDFERVSAEQALKNANADYDGSRQIMFVLASTALLVGLYIALFVIRRAAEKNQHIYYQANHDSLTGLLNRRAFKHEFELLVEMSTNTEVSNVLMYLDLDQFKIVNDTCGHLAGDELLCQIITLFRNQLRQTDIIARLGGDEFGVLLKNCSISSAKRKAETLRETVASFQFSWQAKELSVGVSIGVVPIKQDGGSMEEILSTADMACLEAKYTGRNKVRVADIDDKDILQRRNEMNCVGRIKTALEEDRLSLYYQPVVSVNHSSDQPAHIEILVRMISADGDLILPGDFIPAAERYGLMSGIDEWVIKHAAQWLQEWNYAGTLPKLMINLSGQSICDESFLTFILKTLDSDNIQPSNICFEITETAAIANLDKAVIFINALKAKGCEFALDDFGSGMCSFAYLKKLPVDYLKIDGSFVKEIVNDPIDCAMVKSINEIGHVMNKKTIAEFVEDEATLEMLKDIGVDYAQGYAIAHPKPLDVFVSRRLQAEGLTVVPRKTSAREPLINLFIHDLIRGSLDKGTGKFALWFPCCTTQVVLLPCYLHSYHSVVKY